MLSPEKPPFPDRQECKKCATHPCRQLFTGRVYPGKTIFVHHRDIAVLPRYKLDLRMKTEDPDLAPALTDAIEVITGTIEITNPRWEPLEEAQEGGDPEIPLMGDKVRLLADV